MDKHGTSPATGGSGGGSKNRAAEEGFGSASDRATQFYNFGAVALLGLGELLASFRGASDLKSDRARDPAIL